MSRSKLITLTALAAVIFVARVAATTGGAAAAARTQSGLPGAQQQQIDAIVQREMTANNVPGVAVGVWSNGRNYVHTYGVADISSRARFQVADRVRIASITKTFTGTAVLRLVDQKKLGLDDPLSRYVAGVPNGDGSRSES